MERRAGIGLLLAAGVLLAGCTSGSPPAAEPIEVPSGDATGSLTVWLMKGSQPQSVINAVNEQFAKTYPDVNVSVQLQDWLGIQDKLAGSLAADTPPDVVEIGNSLTARFADAGLLAQLDPRTFGVGGMLPGSKPSGELNGARYGIPYYGGVRVVVYSRSDFKDAGVEVPTSMAELADAAAALQQANASNATYSAFYFPGRFWYGALPFIWDAGGDVAVDEDGTWKGLLDSPESRAGLTTLKSLVDAYSKAPKDADESANVEAFRTGDVGMMIDSWWVPGALAAGDSTGDVGAFALPGTAPGSTAPTFFGGSDLAVAQGSGTKGLAVEWVKILTGEVMQTLLAKAGGVIPNQEAAFAGHAGNPFLAVADAAALNSRFTPVSPRWVNVESSGVLPDMLEKILTGAASVDDATAEASDAVERTLNG